MENLIIRNATLDDIGGICSIHRDEDDPWREEDECRAWIARRIERGFYIRFAMADGKSAAHAEWIVSEESGQRRFLYLGMLQVDGGLQGKGIGRAMIRDGIEYAGENGCAFLSTIPETDNNSRIFYEKCGFIPKRKIYEYIVDTAIFREFKYNRIDLDAIRMEDVVEKQFVFGVAQSSSRHIFEVNNYPPDGHDIIVKQFSPDDGCTLIQISTFPDCDSGWCYCLSSPMCDIEYLIKCASGFAYETGLNTLNFMFYEEYKSHFQNLGFIPEYINTELIYEI